MATSPPPMPPPNSARPKAVRSGCPIEAPSAIVGSATTTSVDPARTTGRVPSRITSGPEERIPSIDPIERPKSTSPICAVEASSRSRTAGVRVTHADMLRPGSRNRA